MENAFYIDRANLSRGIFRHVTTDTPVAIRLRYIGTGTVTSVIVTTATDVTMITSDGGTNAYLFSSYGTVGALVDAINADGIFEAIALDALRTFATTGSSLKAATVSSSVSEEGLVIWDIVTDTSTSKQLAACFDPAERGFLATQRAKNHRVHLTEIKYNCDVNAGAADAVQIWVRKGATETQIAGYLSVDATLTTINFASGNGKYTAKEGNQIIVLVKDATSLADGGILDIAGILE